ncbi:MAG: sugar phosphate isomerase/epimerase [Planctomycetota bacterium]|nr:sugar phosphate isomerase/epimerase [Planctomycetota bacterium]
MTDRHSLAFAYNTNGFAHHRLDEALEVIAELGYQGVALTLDVHHLDPVRATDEEVDALKDRLRSLGLRIVIETGGRYILDPRRKHYPSLLSAEGRERRIEFLLGAVRIANRLGAEAVSLWSGRPDPGLASPDLAERHLRSGIEVVSRGCEGKGVRLALEPEPGMLVDTLGRFDALVAAVRPADLGLTLDIGHAHCLEREPTPEIIHRYGDRIWNVHIEDIRGKVHEHLPFGEGDIDFPPILDALRQIRYAGLVSVELSRNSHDAPLQARKSIEFLRSL